MLVLNVRLQLPTFLLLPQCLLTFVCVVKGVLIEFVVYSHIVWLLLGKLILLATLILESIRFLILLIMVYNLANYFISMLFVLIRFAQIRYTSLLDIPVCIKGVLSFRMRELTRVLFGG